MLSSPPYVSSSESAADSGAKLGTLCTNAARFRYVSAHAWNNSNVRLEGFCTYGAAHARSKGVRT
eukprot:1400423-Rhodomonas_salina.2